MESVSAVRTRMGCLMLFFLNFIFGIFFPCLLHYSEMFVNPQPRYSELDLTANFLIGEDRVRWFNNRQ